MDPLSIAASAISIIQGISATYNTIKHIKGVPSAFQEVGKNLRLAEETLGLAHDQLRATPVKGSTDEKAINDAVMDCKEDAEKLNTIFQEIGLGKKKDENAKDWSTLVNVYRATVLRLGKSSRVETLMQGILKKLDLLTKYQVFKLKEESKKLANAIQRLSEVEPSLQDSELEQSGVNFNQSVAGGGTGNQFSNQGTMNNSWGNQYHSQAMTIAYFAESMSMGRKDAVILKWLQETLHPLPLESTQLETYQITNAVPGAGKWFLSSQNFIEWRDGKSRKLWCPGIPGAGKTVLASIIIRHLRDHCFPYGQITCIYFYFEYRKQKSHTHKTVFSTLLIQLLQSGNKISAEIKRRQEDGQRDPTEADLLEMLTSQLEEFDRVFMVIDALDECSDAPGFLKACEKLPDNVHMLLTSRPISTYARIFSADKENGITADNDDVREYLKVAFRRRHGLQEMVDAEQRNDSTFQDKVLGTIIEKSQGMFSLASRYMEFLASSYDIQKFKGDLANLSKRTDEVYRTALERIKTQDERSHNLAISVLAWLTFGKRVLKTDELAHAIAISNSVDSIRAQNAKLPTRSKISSTDALTLPCAGLVLVDEEYQTIRLTHSTAEAYLKDEGSIVQYAHSKMAKTCLMCLTYIPLMPSSDSARSPDELGKYCEDYPILRYAANHWSDHHLSSGKQGRVYELAWDFLSDRRKLDTVIQFMDDFRVHHERNVSGLHLAAYFGLSKLVRTAMKHNKDIAIDTKTLQGETPLHWAVRHGQKDFLHFLVREGADLDVSDKHGKTALHVAISDGDTALVEVLLSSKRPIDLQHADSRGWTPLRLAASNSQSKVVEMLLRKGAEVDAHDKDGWTALRWAAVRGNTAIVKLLLDNEASPEPLGNDQWTILSWAAQEGREDFIKLLAEKRVDLDVTNEDGCTALRLAVKYRHNMTAWLLIRARADVNKADKKGFTAVHEAVSSNETSILFLLLENGAKVNVQTKLGLTPLHMAASHGNESVLWLLLQKQADWNQRDSNKRTALHWAIAGGHVNVVHFLTWSNRSITFARDDEERTALHVAASQGNIPIMEILLNSGADIDSQDMQGQTPLHLAVYQEHEQVVMCLIQAEADIDFQDMQGQTALHLAVYQEHEQIVMCLIQRGADMEIRDKKKQTAADLAALSRKESINRVFRQAGTRRRALDPGAPVRAQHGFHFPEFIDPNLRM